MSAFADKLRLWIRLKTMSVGHLFVKEPKPEKWVFILGCYNSGTTLLHKLLANHSEIGSMPNEGQFYTNQLPRGADIGLPRLWAMKPDFFYLNETSATKINVSKMKRDWAWFYNHPSRKVLVEKTILHSARSRWLQKVFPNAYFISIFRNGYAVSEGIARKEHHPIQTAARQWAISNDILLNDIPFLRNSHILFYEDLVAHPEEELQKITHFLDLSELPSTTFSKEFKIHKVDSAIKNMNEESFKRLSKADILTINAEAGEVLKKLSYSVIDPAY